MSIPDVCLILEGTYPYVSGGVSTWAHNLIQSQNHLTFSLVCILPPEAPLKRQYDIPENVVEIKNVFLQKMPQGAKSLTQSQYKELFEGIEIPILELQHRASLKILKKMLDHFKKVDVPLGSNILLNSKYAWNMLLRMYRLSIGEGSFLNFFWSCRGLLAGLYSILLQDVPEARLYHSLCTGYAGLYMAKARIETNKPCMITEHGIYTNERRIEITAANWLNDQKAMNLHLIRSNYDRDLKDYWIDTFSGYSKLSYECADKIVTLYEGNQSFQIEDGADPSKLCIVPNGIDIEKYAAIKPVKHQVPTIALIGRVVSIKAIKSFISAISLLKETIDSLNVLIMGPTDEEKEYYEECVEMVKNASLDEMITFTGKVNIQDYLPKIDVVVLTSISEAQPLVILEAGASGIPCVVTDVGSCREMVYGRSDEDPNLGKAGVVTNLSDPKAVAEGIKILLTDKEFYKSCSKAIKERVKTYYNIKDQDKEYKQLYEDYAWQE